MKKLIILIIFTFLLSGCSALKILNPMNLISKSSSANIQYTKADNYEYEYYKDSKSGVVFKTVKKSSEKAVPKQTLGEKIGAWFAKTTTITIILIAAGLFFAPTATISFLFWSRAKIGRALTETVRAIKLSSAVRESEKLHNALAAEQSITTKKLVNDIKTDI